MAYDALPHKRIAVLPGFFDNTISLFSAGKIFSCTGYAVGSVHRVGGEVPALGIEAALRCQLKSDTSLIRNHFPELTTPTYYNKGAGPWALWSSSPCLTRSVLSPHLPDFRQNNTLIIMSNFMLQNTESMEDPLPARDLSRNTS
ncbi:Kynurenine--oxoglutarate transaminase 3 [Phytophthora ramorum]|nr:hypothetical protein KRP22_8444 [Phytophthora ramorum]